MDVSIIIVNYNTKNLLVQCLKSIYQHTNDLSFEIIVVDNASIDGSQQMIKSEFSNVILIESKENLGFGKANNLGAKQASGTFLFLLNSDTILLGNSSKILFDYFTILDDPRVALLGCKILDNNKIVNVSYGNFPSVYQELFEYGFSKIFKNYYRMNLSPSVIDDSAMIKQVDFIVGADMFFKKSVFDQLNGFDNDFFLYYEETELCFRLKQMNYKAIWFPHSSIIHHIGASSKNGDSINYWYLNQFNKSKYLYYQKCHGKLIASIVKYISIPKILIINLRHESLKILKILLKIGTN